MGCCGRGFNRIAQDVAKMLLKRAGYAHAAGARPDKPGRLKAFGRPAGIGTAYADLDGPNSEAE